MRRYWVAACVAMAVLARGALQLPAAETSPAATPPANTDEWVDAATGHRIIRLSRLPGASTGLYFHQKVYTADGRKMVFLNTPPGGKPRICVYDFSTKQDEVILDQPPDGGGFRGLIVAPRRREALYHSADKVYATNLDTKQTRVLGTLPEAWSRGAGFGINADETLLTGSFMDGRADVPPGTPKGEMMEKVFAAKLPNSLYTIRTDDGTSKVIYTTDTWLGHVQFSPTDPGLLMFCHEGPWHKLDRIWTIRADGSGVKLIHQRKQPMEIAGHEFWDRSGESIWFDLQTPKGEQFFLASDDLNGNPLARYALTRDEWSVHYNQSHDGKRFCGDGGDARQVAHASNGKWIWLFTPHGSGAVDAERLCSLAEHDYKLEPNVRFSPDDRWVIFHATIRGSPQVYAVEVNRDRAGQ